MIYLVILFSLFSNLASYGQAPSSVAIDLINTEDFNALLNFLPDTFTLESLTYSSDVLLSEQEFFYLTNLYPGQRTRHECAQGLFYLKLKNKFESVRINVLSGETGLIIHMELNGAWIFNKVYFKGLWSGNDRYRHCYLLESGEFFDMNKHNHSKEKIEEAFKQEGFFNGSVIDSLKYNDKNKTVTVTIELNRGNQFVIEDVFFDINAHQEVDQFTAAHKEYYEKKLYTKFSHRFIGSSYNHALLNKEAKKLKLYLFKQGFLHGDLRLQEHIDYKRNKITLHFLVTIHHKKNFIFQGNNFFTKKQLVDLIFSTFYPSGIFSESLIRQEIIDEYQKKGFWNVAIESESMADHHCYFINEGNRAHIKRVQFKGLDDDNARMLTSFFSFIEKESAVDEDRIKKALNACIDFFIERGFVHAALVHQEYIPCQEQDFYDLHIIIDQGKRCYIKNIIIEQFPELIAQGPFACGAHIYFNPHIVTIQRQWLLNHFRQQGFFYVTIVPELVYEDNYLTILWKIEKLDKKLTFGKTIIAGASNYPFDFVMRELEFEQGCIWQREKLESSIGKLRKLGIFDGVNLYPYQLSIPEENKPIIIRLHEDDPFEIRVRIGFQQVSKNLTFRKGTTYKLGSSLLYKNPFNEGGFIKADVDLTRFYRNLALMYKRPWIFCYPISMLLKGYSNKYTQPVFIGSDKPLYQALQQGFLMSAQRCWNNIDLGFNSGIEVMETSDLSIQLARAINFESDLIDKKIPYFFLEPNVVFNYLDDQLNPTCGSLIVLSIKTMIPFKKPAVSFVKVLHEQAFFFPLLPLVLGMRLRFGHIFNQEFAAIMPPERFYLGGPNSLRSYEPDFAPPLGCFIDDNGKEQLVPQGGRTMVNFNVEFRFPLFNQLDGVIFQDIGMLVEKSFTEIIKGNRFLAGTGFGFRYQTPLGPVRFDMGFKWHRVKEEKSYAWFLTLGQAF